MSLWGTSTSNTGLSPISRLSTNNPEPFNVFYLNAYRDLCIKIQSWLVLFKDLLLSFRSLLFRLRERKTTKDVRLFHCFFSFDLSYKFIFVRFMVLRIFRKSVLYWGNNQIKKITWMRHLVFQQRHVKGRKSIRWDKSYRHLETFSFQSPMGKIWKWFKRLKIRTRILSTKICCSLTVCNFSWFNFCQ